MNQGRDRKHITYDSVERAIIQGVNETGAAFSEAKAEARAAMSEIGGMSAEAKVGIENREFLRGIAECDAELKKLAAMKADPHVEIDDSAFNVAAASILAKKEALEKKINIPVGMDSSQLRQGATALRGLNKDLQASDGWFRRSTASLGKMRLQMGVFSGTVRQVGLAFTFLGPVIFGLLGTLSALVGVVGTGLTGALSVGGAAMAGFGLTVAGLLPSLKQLWTEMKTAPSVIGPLHRMRDALTGDIRQNFFRDAHQAVQTLQSDFPTFERGATSAFGAASRGFQQWMHGLRSPEAKQILSQILSGFTGMLPGVMRGLGSLGATLGRVLGSASKELPSLSQGFSNWANSLMKSVGSGTQLDAKMNRLVGHMRDLGHFSQATGRALVTFFNAGANSGDNLLKSMTGTINQWNSWMHSVAGQNSLQTFFHRSTQLARQLFPAIARIGTALANFSVAAEPLTQGAATALNALAKAAAAVPPPLLAAAGAALVFSRAFTMLKGAAVISTLTSAASAASDLALAFRAGGISFAAETAGIGAGVAALVPAVGVFAGVTLGARALSNQMDEMSTSEKEAIARHEATMRAVEALPARYNAYRDSLKTLKAAQDAYSKATQDGNKNSDAAGEAIKKLNGATKSYNVQLGLLNQSIRSGYNEATGDASRSTNNLNNYLKSTDTYLTNAAGSFAAAQGKGAQFNAALQQNGSSVLGVIRSLKSLGLSARQVGLTDLPAFRNQLDQFNQSQQTAAVQLVNSARAVKGLSPVLGAAGQQVGKFMQQFGNIKGAKHLAITTNAPAQIGQIAKLSNTLNRVGAKKTVAHIIAEGKPADQTIKELQSKVEGIAKKRGVAHLDAKDDGTPKIARFKAAIDKIASEHHTVLHLLGAPAAVAGATAATNAAQAFNGTSTHTFLSVYKSQGTPPGHYAGGVVSGFAGGGEMERAYTSAMARASRDSQHGARVDKPTFITGEENRREYVIATNPAYRKSNLQYLAQAARELGTSLIPGFKAGKAASKPKKKAPDAAPKVKGYQPPVGADVDALTGPGSTYDKLHKDIDYFEAKFSVDQRRYQGSFLRSDLDAAVDDKNQEIGTYGALLTEVKRIIGATPDAHPIPGKAIPKGKGKAAQKAKKQAQAYNQAVSDYNSANKQGTPDLTDEIRMIPILQQGLQLDIDELKNGAQVAAGLQNSSFNAAGADILRSYTSNMQGIVGSGSMPGIPSATGPGTIAMNPSGSVTQTTGSGVTTAGGSGGGNTYINNFAAPPPDPFTWTQQQAFEVMAS
jgi:hypothetical protein